MKQHSSFSFSGRALLAVLSLLAAAVLIARPRTRDLVADIIAAAPSNESPAEAPQRPIRHTRASASARSVAADEQPASYYLVEPRDAAAVGGNEVHDYGHARLVALHNTSSIRREVLSRITPIEDPSRVGYRGWSGGADLTNVGAGDDGYYIVTFLGPSDSRWQGLLHASGATVVDTAPPYGLVVRANGTRLVNRAGDIRTTRGNLVVRGVFPVPRDARLDAPMREIVAGGGRVSAFAEVYGARLASDGRAVVRVIPFADQDREAFFAEVATRVTRADAERGYGHPDAFLLHESDILSLLDAVPGIAYLELQYDRAALNNLAPKDYVSNAAAQWTDSLGNPRWTGAGFTVAENDDGLDIDHADFGGNTASVCTNAHGVVIACNPNGAGVNKGFHGTHVAGSVLGRGVASPQPGPCSEATTGLTPLRGMAYDAKMAINIMLSCGGTCGDQTELGMMQWGYQQGARISTNSWGYTGAYDYGQASADVDTRVRDGNGAAAGNQDLMINFAAANDGPGASTVSRPGTGKNLLTVGASDSDRYNGNINLMADFSSRGPSQGRIKPDISSPGQNVLSTRADTDTDPADCGGTRYRLMSGTSMATPVTSGMTAQFFQFFNTTFGALPKPATAKAALINGAVDMGYGYMTNTPPNSGTGAPQAQNVQGWGRTNLGRSIDGPPGGRVVYFDQTSNCTVGTGQTAQSTITVNRDSVPLKITLVWTDPPGAAGCASCLINNLNLVVTAPNGTVYRGNQFTSNWSTPNPGAASDTANNVENVFVQNPVAGTWTIQVAGVNVPTNPPNITGQDFSVVASADLDTAITAFTRAGCTPGSAPNCSATAPAGVTATANGNNRIDVSWTTNGAAQYRVYRSTNANGPFSTLLGTVSAPPFVDGTVSGGITYYYTVRAVSSAPAACESGNSASASAVATGVCDLPPVFAGLTSATNGYAGSCGITLSWSAASSPCGGAVTYNIYRSTTSGFTPSLSNRIASGAGGTSFGDTQGLVSGTKYYYVVRASVNGVEETNTTQKSNWATGATGATTFLFRDNFDCNRQSPGVYGTTPGPWWTEMVAGADTTELWHIAPCNSQACASTSPDYSYRWGGAANCTSNYSNNKENAVVLGGNGSVNPAVNGIVIPGGSQNVRLKFFHTVATEQNFDGVYLLYSTTSNTGPYEFIYDIVDPTKPYISSGGFGGRKCHNGADCWTGTIATTEVTVNIDALAGQTVWFRWRSTSDNIFNADGYSFDDVRVEANVPATCTTVPSPLQLLTAAAGDGQNTLDWMNPSAAPYGSTVIRARTDGVFPTSATDGTAVTTSSTGGIGGKASFVHTATNGTTYHYAAFVDNGSGTYSTAKTVIARPQAMSGATKWIYNTGAAALTPPGIGSVYAVSNDRWLHSMNATGGTWPSGWTPFVMNAPSQARPPVPTVTISGTPTKVVYLGSQDGNVYCINANTGAQIWRTATGVSPAGSLVQGAIAGIFTNYGGAYNLVFAATRHATADNVIYAFDAATGAQRWTFNNGGAGAAIGIVSGDPWVQYSNRLYFTSRTKGNGSNGTLWCLSFTDTGASACSGYPKAVGDIDGSPSIFGGKVYVGTNNGTVYAFDEATGNQLWSYATGDGPVKGFINPDFTGATTRIYFTTTTRVWALSDNGASASLPANWPITTIAAPSIPLFTGSSLLLGSSDGRLYEIFNLTNATPSIRSALIGTGSESVGSPSLDFANAKIYVGTDAGRIYATTYPLP